MAKKKAKKASRAKSPAKAKAPSPIPKGYPPLMPGVQIPRCGEAIEFYKRIFGAKERTRFQMPDGKVAHCELEFGPSILMLGEAVMGPPQTASLMLYVKDVDSVFQNAVAAGAKAKQELKNQFYGDRTGRLLDPFGNEWVVATHIEDVSEKEMHRRATELEQQVTPPAQPAQPA
jgi:PhnB protein